MNTIKIESKINIPSVNIKKPAATISKQNTISQPELLPSVCLANFYPAFGSKMPLRKEIWSTKKILNAVDFFSKVVDKMIESKDIRVKTIEKAIKQIIPKQECNRIKVKDFSEFRKDMEKEGFSKKLIEANTRSFASTIEKNNRTLLYINTKNKLDNKMAFLNFKVQMCHELKHALSGILQPPLDCVFFDNMEQANRMDYIFSSFENSYHKKYFCLDNVDLDLYNMLDFYGFKDKKGLYENFEKNIKKITNNEPLSKKDFSYLKYRSKEEKEAYLTEKFYRDYHEKSPEKDKPVDRELKSLLYEEMEKFFAEKMKTI